MRKFKLQLDDLRIDSFHTTPVEKKRGTVFGEQQCTCPTCTCPGCPTCGESCNGTCGDTCNETCESCYDTCEGGTDFQFTCHPTCTTGIPTHNDGINCT